MNIVPAIKFVAGTAASLGVGAVVGNAIKATTPDSLSKVSKVLVVTGGLVASAAIGDFAGKYVEDSIQSVADGFRAGKHVAENVEVRVVPKEQAPEDVKDFVADVQSDDKAE